MSALSSWRDDLGAWAIPEQILAAAPESPWTPPRDVLLRRAWRRIDEPSGPTYELSREALGAGGTVLDVGAGGGATSLPLAGVLRHATAVDTDGGLLEAYAAAARGLAVPVDVVTGRWPDVAARVACADVAVCGHVLYNVADLGPFVAELTSHARRRVVVEISERHPLAPLNPLWEHFHGLARPQRPTAQDAVAALRELGLNPAVTHWRAEAEPEYGSIEEQAEVTRRRLCLPASALDEVRAVLRDARTPGGAVGAPRNLVTLCWPGTAR